MELHGLDGLRAVINEYRAKTAKEPVLIRVSPNAGPDKLYVGEFGGRAPEVVMGVDAWQAITPLPAERMTAVWGLPVVYDE